MRPFIKNLTRFRNLDEKLGFAFLCFAVGTIGMIVIFLL